MVCEEAKKGETMKKLSPLDSRFIDRNRLFDPIDQAAPQIILDIMQCQN